jgi:hypothetical protein
VGIALDGERRLEISKAVEQQKGIDAALRSVLWFRLTTVLVVPVAQAVDKLIAPSISNEQECRWRRK